ncbi:ATP-binding protein [Streptosporangium sp. V21-05]|uniref:ATP-binding protein n=1 Tax=Streptosporangium sp. V21-05 TaxID=3446115 RepID=UPI003F52F559
MGDSFSLLLLGAPELAVGGRPVRIRSAKTRALLCYLATTPGARSRAELAGLLWGERPDANARGSLRLALSELRKDVGGWLDITRDHVGLRAGDDCFVDYRQLTRDPTVAGALRLWRGEFLDGLSFGDAPAFAGWLECERRRARLVLRELLVRAGPAAREHVVRLARIVTELDPYDEEAHRVLITSLARSGNRAAALACYEELRLRLARELGVDPAPETRALRQDLTPRPATARRAAPPVPGSELVGRESDIRRLRALLSRQRLVTLSGPGGIGKTRLAIAAAEAADRDGASLSSTRTGRYDTASVSSMGTWKHDTASLERDGAPPSSAGTGKHDTTSVSSTETGKYDTAPLSCAKPGEHDGASPSPADVAFVSFVGVRAEAAVTTLARRLGVDLSPPRPAAELLLAALAGRSTLLVLDNLEHLPSFDGMIAEILRVAPDLRVLATSRRRLDVPGQVVVEVEGLAGPDAEALFVARALKARPGFDPGREAPLVAAICAATGGLPLAIELAAGLLRAVPCADLAERLGVDTGLLCTAGPAVRSRHASMRAVFETSWRLLDPARRAALAALSVFGGGCTLRAALEVAATSPEVLVHLVDHSMLRLTPSGRYTLHPVIQQLAAAHLEDPGVRERHARHYARLLDRHATALQDGSDAEVVRVLGAEMDNIRLAWRVSGQPRFLDHYWTLCLRLRLYEESAAIVREHLDRPARDPRPRARLLRMAAVSSHQLARERAATRLARAALDTLGEPLPATPVGLATALLTAATRQAAHRLLPVTAARRLLPVPRTDEAEVAQALTLLARLAYHRQDLPVMLVTSLRQLNAADSGTDPALRAESYANFATIARLAGRHRIATRYGGLADQALSDTDHPDEAVHRARLARGIDLLHAGRFEDAKRSFTEGRSRTIDPRVAENCAGMLAETALWQGEFAAAATGYAQTEELAVARVGGDDIGRHWCLTGRAEALSRLDGVPVERIRELLAAARASHERRRTHAKEFGLRDSPASRTIQELRLLTIAARLDPARAPAALAEALTLAERLPTVQPGMLECWTSLAELLGHAGQDRTVTPLLLGNAGQDRTLAPLPLGHARQDRTVPPLLLGHLSRYAARNPGAAARIGWALALVLAALGERRRARRAAERAMATAERLAAPYDHRRAESLARALGSS